MSVSKTALNLLPNSAGSLPAQDIAYFKINVSLPRSVVPQKTTKDHQTFISSSYRIKIQQNRFSYKIKANRKYLKITMVAYFKSYSSITINISSMIMRLIDFMALWGV